MQGWISVQPCIALPEGSQLNVPLLRAEQHWTCPNCLLTEVTHEARPHTRYHACRGLRGLTAPMIPEGVKCKVEAMERQDYIGPEMVQKDGEGRPIMSIVTTRDDGSTDCAVLAPTAVGFGGKPVYVP